MRDFELGVRNRPDAAACEFLVRARADRLSRRVLQRRGAVFGSLSDARHRLWKYQCISVLRVQDVRLDSQPREPLNL